MDRKWDRWPPARTPHADGIAVDYDFIDRRCPSCSTMMVPFSTSRDDVALRCGTCGLVAI